MHGYEQVVTGQFADKTDLRSVKSQNGQLVDSKFLKNHDGSKHALWHKEVPFWGPHDGRQHFGVQIPQKPSKMAFYRHVQAATNGFKANDVIEDWRHWLRFVH